MTTLPLSDLRFGHEHPGLSLNSRATDREANIPSLMASIRAKGVIEPLVIVWREPGKDDPEGRVMDVPYVVDGNRRLAALHALGNLGEISFDAEIAVIERDDDDALAIETSLIANLEREPLHPVDAYEAFALLESQGAAPTEIAARFGLSVNQVARRLALGRLAPEVREAWRAGEIGADAAQAFTVVGDPVIQAKVFAACQDRGQLYAHWIKTELGAKGNDADLSFIGEEAYLAAGGRIVDDLFSDHRYILDGAILNLLVHEKLHAAGDALEAEGWKWSMLDDDAPDGIYSWAKIDPEPVYTADQQEQLDEIERQQAAGGLDSYESNRQRAAITAAAKATSFTPEQKARSGVLLSVNYAGEIVFKRGLLRPDDTTAADRAGPAVDSDGEAAEEGPTAEPKVVVDRLREALTLGWATVVNDYHGMAMELFLATWLAGPASGSPLTFKAKGWGQLDSFREWVAGGVGENLTLAEALAAVQGLGHAERSRLFNTVIACSLDMTTAGRDAWHGSGVTDEGVAAVARCYTGVGALEAMRGAFDGAGYFDAAKKGHALVAIEECMGTEAAKQWAGRKKGDAAKFAQEVAAQKGWLPPMLRVPGYSVGPTPLADRAAAAKDSVKAKRARRAASESAGA